MPILDTSPAKVVPIHSVDLEEFAKEILDDNKVIAEEKEKTLPQILKSNGLDTNGVVSELARVLENSDSDSIKMRAIETALKLNGVMNDKEGKVSPVFNIIINDPNSRSGINPIILPRELLIPVEARG